MIVMEFHPEAQEELLEAEKWYRERSEVAAQAFTLEIDNAIKRIIETPERWSIKRKNERHYVLPRFPYSIIYRIKFNKIYIVAVAHHRRRPVYWRKRI
jgi:plasmid stabilization system protein ParE